MTYTLEVDHRTHCGFDLNVTGCLLIQILIRIGESKGTMSDNLVNSLPFACRCFPKFVYTLALHLLLNNKTYFLGCCDLMLQ